MQGGALTLVGKDAILTSVNLRLTTSERDEISMENWVAYTSIAGNVVVVIGIIFAFLQWKISKQQNKRIKEENVEKLTKEIMYIVLYYGIDPGRGVYIPNEGTIEIDAHIISQRHQQIKERLMQEV